MREAACGCLPLLGCTAQSPRQVALGSGQTCPLSQRVCWPSLAKPCSEQTTGTCEDLTDLFFYAQLATTVGGTLRFHR